jgi:hypothetical protein
MHPDVLVQVKTMNDEAVVNELATVTTNVTTLERSTGSLGPLYSQGQRFGTGVTAQPPGIRCIGIQGFLGYDNKILGKIRSIRK